MLEGTHGDNIDNPLPRTTNNSISVAKLLNNSETAKNNLQSAENEDIANATPEAKRQKAERLGEKLHTPVTIIEDTSTITHPNPAEQQRRRNAKGLQQKKGRTHCPAFYFDISNVNVLFICSLPKQPLSLPCGCPPAPYTLRRRAFGRCRFRRCRSQSFGPKCR